MGSKAILRTYLQGGMLSFINLLKMKTQPPATWALLPPKTRTRIVVLTQHTIANEERAAEAHIRIQCGERGIQLYGPSIEGRWGIEHHSYEPQVLL